jgi:hypothetical protein
MNDLLQAVGICLIILTLGTCADFCSRRDTNPERTYPQYLIGK